MIIHKIAVYKRRTIIFNILSNPVGIGLWGIFVFWDIEKGQKRGCECFVFGICTKICLYCKNNMNLYA